MKPQHPFNGASSAQLQESSVPCADSFCQLAEGWGPSSRGRFGLSLCFEYSVLYGALSVLAILSFFARIVYMKTQCKPHGLGRTAWIYWPTQVCMGGAALLAFITTLRLADGDSSPAALFGYSAMGCAWTLAVILNRYEHLYSIRSSDLIFSFYVVAIATTAIHARTLFIISAPSLEGLTTELKVTLFIVGTLLIGFVIEAWPRGDTKVQRSSSSPIYEKANLFAQSTYYFYQPIISLSVKRTLTIDDIANILPDFVFTRNARATLESYWARACAEAREKNTRPSLFQTICRRQLIKGPALVALRLSRVCAAYAVPSLLSLLLAYFQDIQRGSEVDITASRDEGTSDATKSDTSLSYGLFLVVAMFLAGLANAILLVVSRQYCAMLGIETRSALVSMVYRKALKLSPRARQESTMGAIINHMSIDADLWVEGFIFLTMSISIPAEIGFGLWLLHRLLGWSAWVGMLTMVLMSPLQVWNARVFAGLARKKWAHTDERIRITTEALSAIKVLKLYTWENAFLKKILAVRNLELDILRRTGYLHAIMSIVLTSSTMVICLTTLSVFATWGGPNFTPGTLTPQVVFVSMTLFAMLRAPISSLTEATKSVVALLVSTKRLQVFLMQEETDHSAIVRERDMRRASPGEPTLLIKDATFSWVKERPEEAEVGEDVDETVGLLSAQEQDEGTKRPIGTLQNINLSIERGSLVAIVGRVGQGKSSLLSAIIGELYKLHGYVKTIGRIAYVPQQAWILNATLRDNVLFGNAFDQEKYFLILHACGLEPDLEMLPAGDLTEIGERGINLSGGQKQRVSLARAAYADADIYLLDDPLSAVDAHVDHHLWTELIGPGGLLRGKTRLLVTHGIHHLKKVDRVVLLKEGRIIEEGPFEELMVRRETFHQLIKEYSVTHRAQSLGDALRTGDASKSSAPVAGRSTDDGETQSHASSESGRVIDIPKAKPLKDDGKKDLKKDTKAQIIVAEEVQVGELQMSVVKAYISALSYKSAALVLGLLVLAQVCLVATNLWLKHWITLSEQAGSDDGEGREVPSFRTFLFVFAMLSIGYIVTFMVSFWIAFAVARIRASEYLHRKLMERVMRLPPAFFDTTPLGRIINRVSSDLASIDDRIPWKLFDTALLGISLLASLVVVAATTPVFLFVSPFIFIAYHIIRKYYLHASRVCKRLCQVTRSPIFQHFQETLAGVSTIRAMDLQDRFIDENAFRMDAHSNTYVAFGYCTRWVEMQTQVVSCLITLMASLWFVLVNRSKGGWVGGGIITVVDAATAGLALSFAMNISNALLWFTRTSCDLYTHMICLERVQEMIELNTEAPLCTDPDSSAGRALEDKRWPPREGSIAFVDYSTRYRQGLDLVLKQVSFKVEGGEHVGIVGRTGAGKSSLTLALFRMIEAADSSWAKMTDNSKSSSDLDGLDVLPSLGGEEPDSDNGINGGRIEIDGIDISTLGLADLRQHLAIIPQEPVLFTGTVRENLDPFQELEDPVLWEALERSHLKSYISSLPGGLSSPVAQNGENFSVGQRSLMCLARALLRKSKVLILDEATSAVDMKTDELIQRTIRAEFKERTILTIAHRIKTVMDSDRILVLEQGRVVEYDSPKVLVKDESSLFYKLAKQAGEL